MTRFRSGLAGFALVSAGQLVSLAGSAMSGLALSVWAWQETGQAATLALMMFCSFAPRLLLSPLAGELIDRWPKKVTLLASDFGVGLGTLATLVLLQIGQLELGQLYALAVWSGAVGAFQGPAFAAAVPALLPEQHYARANGLLGLAQSGANIVAPALAGVLLARVGLGGVLLIDLATLGVGSLALALVTIPDAPRATSVAPQATGPTFVSRLGYGFRYIGARPALRLLALLYFFITSVGAVGMVLLAPLVLLRSGGSEVALGSVMAALGAGGVVGGLLFSVWGGPTDRVRGLLTGLLLVTVCGYGLTALTRTPLGWAAGAFGITFFLPLLSSSHGALWQSYVPKGVQGRVFAARQVIGEAALPLVMLGAAPLADHLGRSPALTAVLGPGAGVVSLFLGAAALGFVVAVVGFALPSVRGLEQRLKHSATL